jgi:HD-like signal output (HDOD) protein
MRPTPEQLQAAIAKIEKLSPAPRVLARALALLRDPQSPIGAVAELISSDPALAADVLRCSNSAFYGSGVQIQSIDQAVQKIGFRETVRLLSLAVSRIVTGCNLDSYGLSADDYWAESLFHGLFMEELARATGGAEPDEAHAVGLLRYLGRLAINQSIHELGGGLYWLGDEPLLEWERETIGFSQAEAGADLLRRWKFPEELIQACAGQEFPALQTPPGWLASGLFFTSSALPQEYGKPFCAVLAPPIGSDFMHHNGLTPDSVNRIFTATQIAFDKARGTFA